MKGFIATAAVALALLPTSHFLAAAELCEVTFLGSFSFPGDAGDRSGLTDLLEDPAQTPHNRLGGFSGIAWTGSGNDYLILPDRGPADGAASYRTRFHRAEIVCAAQAERREVTAKLLQTSLLTDASGASFLGKSTHALRLDPEGICLGDNGNLWVCDEYGPSIIEFRPDGTATGRRVAIPAKFSSCLAGGEPKQGASDNESGIQSNRGFEGVCMTPDGKYLFAALQSPLLQDGALDLTGKRAGLNVRILRVSPADSSTTEYVYQLDDPSLGLSEIVAVSDTEFLVIERDGKAGREAQKKLVRLVDVSRARDVSSLQALPRAELPPGVRPVSKRTVIDLLNPSYGLAGDAFPEKIEGLALGPSLDDGSRILVVTADNDFRAGAPTQVYVFSVRLGQR